MCPAQLVSGCGWWAWLIGGAHHGKHWMALIACPRPRLFLTMPTRPCLLLTTPTTQRIGGADIVILSPIHLQWVKLAGRVQTGHIILLIRQRGSIIRTKLVGGCGHGFLLTRQGGGVHGKWVLHGLHEHVVLVWGEGVGAIHFLHPWCPELWTLQTSIGLDSMATQGLLLLICMGIRYDGVLLRTYVPMYIYTEVIWLSIWNSL